MREVLTALVLVAMVGGTLGVAQVGASSSPQWFYQIPNANVTYGSLLLVDVYGPTNGTFVVTLNPAPFNSSVPVFTQTYQEPSVPTLANRTASGEVRINTTYFAIEALQLTVSEADGTLIGQSLIFITIGIASTTLQNEIDQLQYDLQQNGSLLRSTIAFEYQIQNENWFVIGSDAVFLCVTIFFIIFTRTAAAEKRLGKKLRSIGHDMIHGAPGYIESTGPFKIERKAPVVDPDKIWVADQCNICEMPFTRPALLAHLTGPAHRMKREEAENWIHVDPDAQRRVQRVLGADVREAAARAKKAERKRPESLDLTDILGGPN